MSQQDGIRRYLVATGVTKELPRTHQRLIESVDRVVSLFTTTLGYERATSLAIDPTADEYRRQLRAFCEARKPEDIVTLYHTGHAETGPNGEHRLRTGGEGVPAVEKLPTAELVELMLYETPLQQVLIILDTCFAGRGGAEAILAGMKVFGRAADKTLAVISAAHPTEQITAGNFSRLLEEAVNHPATGGHEPAYLPLAGIVGHIRENPKRPASQSVSESVLFNMAAEQPFLTNPRYQPEFHGLDLFTQLRIEQRELRLEDLRSHFAPRAQGTDNFSDNRWLFMGRHSALRDLSAWLNGSDRQRTAVVTGDPGSGKSAVIGRLVVLSDPRRRPAVPLEDVPTDTMPQVGAIDVAVHARGLTTAQVLAGLSAEAGIAAESAGQLLTAIRNKRLVAAIDAIDESVDPQDLVNRLLRPLVDNAAQTGLRLLLGTRRNLLEALGPKVRLIDLDDDYRDESAIRGYAERCLRETQPGSVYLNAPTDQVRAVASAVAEAAAQSFLVALIAARTLASNKQIPDPANPVWRASLPSSAAEAMEQDLKARLRGDATKARHLLLPLAYAAGAGLPWEDLWAPLTRALSGGDYTDEDIIWLRKEAGFYIVEALEAGVSVYRLYHAALADYLRQWGDARSINGGISDFLVEHLRRTCGHTNLVWQRAHPYTRAHLATHAARAGRLDDLLLDPGFLIEANPVGLMAALSAAQAPEAARAAVAYQRAAHHLDCPSRGERLAYLELSATRYRAVSLAKSIRAARVDQPWRVQWTRLREEQPHRVLKTETDRPILYLGCFSPPGENAFILSCTSETWHVWDPATGQRLADVDIEPDDLLSATAIVHPEMGLALVGLTNTRELYVGNLAGEARRYQIASRSMGRIGQILQRDRAAPLMLCSVLPDGTPVVVIAEDHGVRRHYFTVSVRDIRNGELISQARDTPLDETGLTQPELQCRTLPEGSIVAFLHYGQAQSFAFDMMDGRPLTSEEKAQSGVFSPVLGYLTRHPAGIRSQGNIANEVWLWDPSSPDVTIYSRDAFAREVSFSSTFVGKVSYPDTHAATVGLYYEDISRTAAYLNVTDTATGATIVTTRPVRLGTRAKNPELTVAKLPHGPTVAILSFGPDDNFAFDLSFGNRLEILPEPVRGGRLTHDALYFWDAIGRRRPYTETGPAMQGDYDVSTAQIVSIGAAQWTARIVGSNIEVDVHVERPLHRTMTGHLGPVSGIGALKGEDGQHLLVSGSTDGTIRIWPVVIGPNTHDEDSTGRRVFNLDIIQATRQQWLAAIFPWPEWPNDDSAIQIWDLSSAMVQYEIVMPAAPSAVCCVRLPGDVPAVVAYGQDYFIRGYNMLDGSIVFQFPGDQLTWASAVAGETITADTMLVTTGHGGSSAALWDVRRGKLHRWLRGHRGWVATATIASIRGRPVALTAGHDGQIRVWSANGGRLRRRMRVGFRWTNIPPIRTRTESLALASMPDGSASYVFITDEDGTATMWNLRSGRKMATVNRRASLASKIGCWVIDSACILVITADYDGSLRIRLVRLGRHTGCDITLIERIDIELHITDFRLTSDYRIIINTNDGVVAVQVDVDFLLSRAASTSLEAHAPKPERLGQRRQRPSRLTPTPHKAR
jgi:WD40 repeat protein